MYSRPGTGMFVTRYLHVKGTGRSTGQALGEPWSTSCTSAAVSGVHRSRSPFTRPSELGLPGLIPQGRQEMEVVSLASSFHPWPGGPGQLGRSTRDRTQGTQVDTDDDQGALMNAEEDTSKDLKLHCSQ